MKFLYFGRVLHDGGNTDVEHAQARPLVVGFLRGHLTLVWNDWLPMFATKHASGIQCIHCSTCVCCIILHHISSQYQANPTIDPLCTTNCEL